MITWCGHGSTCTKVASVRTQQGAHTQTGRHDAAPALRERPAVYDTHRGLCRGYYVGRAGYWGRATRGLRPRPKGALREARTCHRGIPAVRGLVRRCSKGTGRRCAGPGSALPGAGTRGCDAMLPTRAAQATAYSVLRIHCRSKRFPKPCTHTAAAHPSPGCAPRRSPTVDHRQGRHGITPCQRNKTCPYAAAGSCQASSKTPRIRIRASPRACPNCRH